MLEKAQITERGFKLDAGRRIDNALINRFSLEEYKQYMQEECEQWGKIFSGEKQFDRQKYNSRLIQDMSNPRYVFVDNPHEYYAVLNCMRKIFGEEYIKMTAIHEAEHYWSAVEEGLQPSLLFFFAGEEGILQPMGSAGIVPDYMTDERFVETVRKVIAAPHDLSKFDKMMLGQ